MLFIIHVYLIMCLWACDKLVATQLLKLWPLKANHSKLVSAFWASSTPWYICWVRHVLTFVLLFKYLDKNPGWVLDCKSLKELGLWSTSQLFLWNWSLHLRIGVIFLSSILWGYNLYTNVLCILSTVFDITLICSYMWDLTSWAHIWCVSSFVLKTGCFTSWSIRRHGQVWS